MAQSQAAEKSDTTSPIRDFKERLDGFIKVQTECLEELRKTNKHWFDRAQTEASLTCDLASKLTAARSFPETMTAYREWVNRRMEMMAEDGKYLLADTQKIMQTSARLLSNVWGPNGSSGST